MNKQQLKQLIREEIQDLLSKNIKPEYLDMVKNYATWELEGFLVRDSIKYRATDEEGSYEFTFRLKVPSDEYTEREIKDIVDDYNYSGPGQAFSRTSTYILPREGFHDVKVTVRGGYDI